MKNFLTKLISSVYALQNKVNKRLLKIKQIRELIIVKKIFEMKTQNKVSPFFSDTSVLSDPYQTCSFF